MAERSRILKEALENAQSLHKSGVIDMRRLQEYEALCATEKGETQAPDADSEHLKEPFGFSHEQSPYPNTTLCLQ